MSELCGSSLLRELDSSLIDARTRRFLRIR